jgi:Mrp family chromosome partitioning ATPase/capsular polysaccharide biosynthesis protein
MDLVDYLSILQRRWIVVAAAGLVALLVGVITLPAGHAATAEAPKLHVSSYKATTTLLQTSSSSNTLPLTTLPIFVASGAVPKAAAKALGFKGDPNLLGQQVSVAIDDKTTTVGVTAVSRDPNTAVHTADAFSAALIDYLRLRAQAELNSKVTLLDGVLAKYRLKRAALTGTSQADDAQRAAIDDAYRAVQQQITTLQVQSATAGFDLDVLQSATAVPIVSKTSSNAATGTNRWLRLALIVGVGLLLGAALALGIERFDTRMRGRRAFEDCLRVPVVANVPALARRRRRKHEVLAVTEPEGGIAEAYRSLRSSLMLLPSRPVPFDSANDLTFDRAHVDDTDSRDAASRARTKPDGSPRSPVVLVVSARAREGKTTSVVNLAATLAEAGRRVMVLDCDFRNPEAHLYLDVPKGQGLSDLLAADKDVSLASVVQPTSVSNVRLASAGTSIAHPGALLGLMGRYVEEARELADIVLIDAPPVLLANDAMDLLPFSDMVAIVGRDGRTTRADGERVSALLARLRVPCLGTVLIASTDVSAAYFAQQYGTRHLMTRRDKQVRQFGPAVEPENTQIEPGWNAK